MARFQAFIRDNQAEGFAYVGSLEVHPTDVTVTGNTATLEDCVVDRSQIVDAETREPLSEQGETVELRRIEMERIGAAWKVVLQEVVGTCTPG